jgi:hypothetical protein
MTTAIPWINSLTDNRGSLWDSLRLGGVVWPGKWTCRVSKKRELDVVKVRRLDGVRILDNGYFGVALSCAGQFWLPQQWDAFQIMLPKFDPQRAGGGRSPLDFYHPAGAMLGVGTVYIAEIGIGEPSNGIMPLALELLQWFPRPKPFVQGFAGTRQSGEPINPDDFAVKKPSANTGDKL